MFEETFIAKEGTREFSTTNFGALDSEETWPSVYLGGSMANTTILY